MYLHHGMTRVGYLLALGVIHTLGRKFHRRTVRREQLKLIAEGEFIALAEHRFPVIITAFDHGGNVRAGGVAGLGVVLAGTRNKSRWYTGGGSPFRSPLSIADRAAVRPEHRLSRGGRHS